MGGRQQRLAGRRRHRVRRHRRRPRRRRRSSTRRRRPPAGRASCCTHGHNDHINAAAELVDRHRRPGVRSTPTTGCSGTRATPTAPPTATSPTARSFTVGDVELPVLHTPGHSPGALLPPRAGASASSSPATRCSAAAPARPVGRTATSRPSSSRSATGCSPCPPETVGAHRPRRRRRRSGPRRRTSRSGSAGVTDPAGRGDAGHTAYARRAYAVCSDGRRRPALRRRGGRAGG